MTVQEDIDALCAELRAIDYWEWLYRHDPSTEADEISHQLRRARRAEILIALQVLHYRSVLGRGLCTHPYDRSIQL